MTQTAKQQDFTLGRGPWIWGLVCASVAATLVLARTPGSTSHAAGAVLGAVVVTLGLAALFGWLTWVLRGRPVGGGRIAFAIVAGLMVLVQVGNRVGTAQTQAVYSNLLQVQQTFSARLAEITTTDENSVDEVPAAITKLDALFHPLQTQFRGKPEAALVQAYRASLIMIATQELNYGVHRRDLAVLQEHTLAGIEAPGELERRVAAIQRFAAGNRAYQTHFEALPANFIAGFDGLSGHDEFVDGVRRGVARERERTGEPIARLLARRQDFAAALQTQYQALVDDRGRWTLAADATLTFDSTELERKHEALSDRVGAAAVQLFTAEIDALSGQ